MGITKQPDDKGGEILRITGRCPHRLTQLQDEFQKKGRRTTFIFIDLCEGLGLLTVWP